jgi:hypothetical protein
VTADDDALTTRDLVPVSGGTWDGLLFDNPNISLPAALTWSFRFPFAEVHREYGSSQIFLDVDWLPLPAASWRSMTGQTVQALGEPAESALARLEAFTDIDGLASSAAAIHSAFHFQPMDS